MPIALSKVKNEPWNFKHSTTNMNIELHKQPLQNEQKKLGFITDLAVCAKLATSCLECHEKHTVFYLRVKLHIPTKRKHVQGS